MSKMVNVAVFGHTGRLGKPLAEILSNHPYSDLVYTESKTAGSKGKLSEAETVFLALPPGESEKYMPRLEGKKIIDLSIDHRSAYSWVYGLPELNKEKIKNAQYVANPGCYATSIVLGLAPLAGKISGVNIASTSGISGAGKNAQKEDNFLVYKSGKTHQQIPEIEKALGLDGIIFVPQRIDTSEKGIISTIFGKYDGSIDELYQQFYKKNYFVIMKHCEDFDTESVNGTNFCNIKVLKYDDKIIVLSALDNIIKGGAGQAVQNFNLMYGFDETDGLDFIEVRKAAFDDIPKISEFTEKYINSRTFKEDGSGNFLKVNEDKVFERVKNGNLLVACVGKHLAGTVALEEYGIAEIRSFAMDNDYELHGIGCKLIEKCKEEAYSKGYEKIYTLTNHKAKKAFEKAGFIYTDTPPEKLKKDCEKCPQYNVNCKEQAMVVELK